MNNPITNATETLAPKTEAQELAAQLKEKMIDAALIANTLSGMGYYVEAKLREQAVPGGMAIGPLEFVPMEPGKVQVNYRASLYVSRTDCLLDSDNISGRNNAIERY